ncbi:hypothetical protein SUDANB121_01437 [Nocardiopsis dassonvillei]
MPATWAGAAPAHDIHIHTHEGDDVPARAPVPFEQTTG